MPSYISKCGLFYPAKEHAVLPHMSGTEHEVYDGPDRAAEFELAQAYGVDAKGKPKVPTFGIDFRHDPDLIARAKSLGFKDVNEFAAAMGYHETPQELQNEIIKKEKIVVEHKDLKRVDPSNKIGGGIDTTGQGNDKLGGFGSNPDGIGK